MVNLRKQVMECIPNRNFVPLQVSDRSRARGLAAGSVSPGQTSSPGTRERTPARRTSSVLSATRSSCAATILGTYLPIRIHLSYLITLIAYSCQYYISFFFT